MRTKLGAAACALALAMVAGVGAPAAANPREPAAGQAGQTPDQAQVHTQQQQQCPRFWVIGVRGSGERRDTETDAGPDADAYIERALPLLPAAETEVLSLPYAAALPGPEYFQSVEDGWVGLQAIIRARARECPGMRIGLVGKSQGAQVINEALNWLATHDTGALAAVRSVLQLADPRSDPTADYHLAVAFPSGEPATRQLDGGILSEQRLPLGADRVTDLCIQGDPVCDAPDKGLDLLIRAIGFPIHDSYRQCCTSFFFPSILGSVFARRLLEPPPNLGPRISVDSDNIEVPEGGTATNGGTVVDPEGNRITMSASVGTVTLSGERWSWTLPNVGQGPQTVTMTATDSEGVSSSVTFTINGRNVPPSVSIDPNQVTTIDEGDRLTAQARFTDAAGDAPFTGTIDWGFGAPERGGISAGLLTGVRQYGDNGPFDVRMSVTDRDGNTGSAGFNLTVRNVDPTAEIDLSAATTINGMPVFLGRVGEALSFSGRSTDPGSDDLTLTWDWDDGPPAPDVSTTHLVNPPDPDPLPSPSVQPRDVSESQSQTWSEACLYDVTFASTDDDDGSDADEVQVIIRGDATQRRGPGYWFNQYKPGERNRNDLSDETLTCYLEIVGLVSRVFDEVRPLPDLAAAVELLDGPGPLAEDKLDRQLLTAWLNFANGALEPDEVVEPDRGTTVAEVLAEAEDVRRDPNASRQELIEQATRLSRIHS